MPTMSNFFKEEVQRIVNQSVPYATSMSITLLEIRKKGCLLRLEWFKDEVSVLFQEVVLKTPGDVAEIKLYHPGDSFPITIKET